MANIFLFLSSAFLFIFLFGRLLEKARVPWIFASLVLGFIFSIYNPFNSIITSDIFVFLADLGMYFLLFIVGFEINLQEMKKKGGFIIKSTFVIIFFEAIFGSLLVHFVFNYNWFVSVLVAISFASVGEVVLIPILDEFKLIKTRLGQSIIGIGVMDNLIEIAMLLFVSIFISSGNSAQILIILAALIVMFLFTAGFAHFKHKGHKLRFMNADSMFLFTIFIVFLFLGIGTYADATALAALLAGISFRTFMPPKRLKLIENEIRAMSYGFFAPLFFLWVGASMDAKYLFAHPYLVIIVVLIATGAKILGSYLVAKNELGVKQSILLGIGLSVRFSTSIIIIKILFERNIVGVDLYSVVIASSIAFNFFVPFLFSKLIVKWKLAENVLQ